MDNVRKILFSMLVIFLAIVLVVVGTFARFQDIETSAENFFQSGTLDLQLWGNDGWTDNGLTKTWQMTAMIPGETESNLGTVTLMQVGTIAGTSLKITSDYTVTEVWQDPDTEDTSLVPDNFAKYLEIIQLSYQDGGWRINGLTGERRRIPSNALLEQRDDWKISDADGIGGVSLFDLKEDPLVNLPLKPAYASHKVSMRLRFHADAGNNLQGDILNGTVKFILQQ